MARTSAFAFRGRSKAAAALKTSAAADSKVSTESSNEGKKCAAKLLYPGDPDQFGRSTWTDVYPESWAEPVENEETLQHALLIRKKQNYDGRKKDDIESIVVQSPLLKQVLGVVLKGYPGVTTNLERLTFEAPFEPFVHRWEKLAEAMENEQHPETKKHIELLHQVLAEELAFSIKAKNDYVANGVITFDKVWTIFQPGGLVYTRKNGQDMILRLSSSYRSQDMMGGSQFSVQACCVDWDGEQFGFDNRDIMVKDFLGTKPITQLEAFPLEFHPDVEALEERLIKRGREFEKLAGYHYKGYSGMTLSSDTYGLFANKQKFVNGRVIIDAYAYARFVGTNDNLVSLNSDPTKRQPCEDEDEDYYFESDQETINPTKPACDSGPVVPLTEDQHLLCNPFVRGYSLKTKKWLRFLVTELHDITWSSDAFDSLVLPEDQKELILSFAESQVKFKHEFDDVIEGKGQGIIMLLSGPPGVGKTLTAESVAESMKVPLYQMSAGDLGLDPQSVESTLSNILEMVVKWDAVLLLDECDVFLEERSAHDLERNKLVSIFLRTLEYHSGILFLTTNRVETMDAAFQSRIHVSLEYPELDAISREHIWRNFLARGKDGRVFKDRQLQALAKVDLNGRQIKNVIKTSQLLASRKETVLAFEHVLTVLKIEGKAQGILA